MDLKKGLRVVILLWVTLGLFGCAWFQTKEEKTAKELAEEGMAAFRDNNYSKTIEAFEKLRDWYPFSEYAMLAELRLGDAHYHRKEYEEAISAYEEFERLHPKNESVPYVVYQIGRCYFDRRQVIDRDQGITQKAVESLERLIRSYPDSPFARKAKGHLRICKKSLAEHEFYVGKFYYKAQHYKAALERFKTILTSYPDFGIHYQALQHITLCQTKIENALRAAQ
ncbi:MAG: outer membrane protein assembly factor BamD [Deltaproteobacteria bacterium]|jgi:outer membrane protein assembly factor BamD